MNLPQDVANQALSAQQIAARRKEESEQIAANERLVATARAPETGRA